MYIYPKISDDMTSSELRQAKELARYSIKKDFISIASFKRYCKKFKSEKEIIKDVYRGSEFKFAPYEDDLIQNFQITAIDSEGRKKTLIYRTEEEEKAMNERIQKALDEYVNSPGYKRRQYIKELMRKQNGN